MRLSDCHTVNEGARIKHVEAIAKTKGCVARWCADRRLALFRAVRVSEIEPRRKILVIFVISKSAARAKLACRWQPR